MEKTAYINVKVDHDAAAVRINERDDKGTFHLRKVGSVFFDVPKSQKTAAFLAIVPEILDQLPEGIEKVIITGTNALFQKEARLSARLFDSELPINVYFMDRKLARVRWELNELINDAKERQSTIWSDISQWQENDLTK